MSLNLLFFVGAAVSGTALTMLAVVYYRMRRSKEPSLDGFEKSEVEPKIAPQTFYKMKHLLSIVPALGISWYLYWVWYDVGFWGKSLVDVAPISYAGLALCTVAFSFGLAAVHRLKYTPKPAFKPIALPEASDYHQEEVSQVADLAEPETKRTFLAIMKKLVLEKKE